MGGERRGAPGLDESVETLPPEAHHVDLMRFVPRVAVSLGTTTFLLLAIACGTSGRTSDPSEVDAGGLCLEQSCRSDDQCGGCSGGKTVCDVAGRVCVACGPAAGGRQCPAGQKCTNFGDCVPSALECPVDPQANPTVACATSADCGACDPKHRLCDGATKRCVGCTPSDSTRCVANEVCVQSRCAARCPRRARPAQITRSAARRASRHTRATKGDAPSAARACRVPPVKLQRQGHLREALRVTPKEARLVPHGRRLRRLRRQRHDVPLADWRRRRSLRPRGRGL